MATPAGAAGVRNKRKQPPNTRDQPSKRRPAPPSNSSAANKQKLLNRAVGVLHGEILNGQRVKAPNDIPRILNSHAADYLKSNPFEHLKTADHLQIFIDVTNIANSAITDAPPPPIIASTQQPTPETERIATPEEEDLLEDDGPLEPLEGEPGEPGDLLFYCPGPKGAKGRRFKCRRSYIRNSIKRRENFIQDPGWQGSIRLTWCWSPVQSGVTKTDSTRFWFIDDEKIEVDFALGRDCMKLDTEIRQFPDETKDMSDADDDDDDDDDNDEVDVDGDSQSMSEAKSTFASGDRLYPNLPAPDPPSANQQLLSSTYQGQIAQLGQLIVAVESALNDQEHGRNFNGRFINMTLEDSRKQRRTLEDNDGRT